MKKGDLNVFDAQKLKQFCRRIMWKLFFHKNWMQNLELQELVIDALDADMELVERVQRMESSKHMV